MSWRAFEALGKVSGSPSVTRLLREGSTERFSLKLKDLSHLPLVSLIKELDGQYPAKKEVPPDL